MQNNPLYKIPAIEVPGLKFQVVEVTPIVAAEWLKRNNNNRKVKDPTLEIYSRDMKNGDWLLTHQAIAFDQESNLIDGQHRLMAIVRSRTAVPMMVICGVPTGKGKRKTMDAVDRGCNRSIVDQLRLQHGIQDSGPVVQVCNAIASACLKQERIRKSSIACVLSVVGLFPNEVRWILDSRTPQRGLRNANVLAAMALGRAVWPDKASDFWTRLKTGENLSRDNPALHLRNWLMGEGQAHGRNELCITSLNCLKLFVDGKPMTSLRGGHVQSGEGLEAVLKAIGDKAKKIQALYGAEAASIVRIDSQAKKTLSPFSPEALAIGHSLSQYFSNTDLQARTEESASAMILLSNWKQRGWIEPAAPGSWTKTEAFPVPEQKKAA